MTLAAIDRLVHHATIFEMNVESYRRKTAITRLTHGENEAHDVAAASPPAHVPAQRRAATNKRECRLSRNQGRPY